MASKGVYRRLLVLYPRAFRQEYGDELVLVFEDLAAEHGRAHARRRTALDLILTVPRYRLEHLMNEQHSSTALSAIILGLAALGVLGVVTGFGPPALFLLVAAVVVAVAQRSALARSIRTPDTDVRRSRLRTAAVCTAVFLGCYGIWIWDVRDDLDLAGVLAGLVGSVAMIAAVVLLLVGLLTPRSPAEA